jgi:hypothetical protein
MHESITLGFLGSARPNKGFDDIPKILDSLKANNIIFTAVIQLPKFEWPEFRQTYNKLRKNHLNVVKFINSSISKSHYQNVLCGLKVQFDRQWVNEFNDLNSNHSISFVQNLNRFVTYLENLQTEQLG